MNVHRDLCTFFFVRIKQLEDNKKNSEKLFNNLPIARYMYVSPIRPLIQSESRLVQRHIGRMFSIVRCSLRLVRSDALHGVQGIWMPLGAYRLSTTIQTMMSSQTWRNGACWSWTHRQLQ